MSNNVYFAPLVVIGLTEAVKRTRIFENRALPFVAIIFGMIFAYLETFNLVEAIKWGVVYGLSAAGLYRSARVVVQNK